MFASSAEFLSVRIEILPGDARTLDLLLKPLVGLAGQSHVWGSIGEGIGDVYNTLAPRMPTVVVLHLRASGRYLKIAHCIVSL